MRVVVLLAILSGAAARADNQFQRKCTVFADPSPIAIRLCRKEAGSPILEAKPARSGFVKVDTGDCLGYVRESCLVENVRRQPSSEIRSSGSNRVRLGIALQGDGIFGRITGVAQGSQGLGFAVSALIVIPVSPSFRFTLRPTYQYLSLGRTVKLPSVLVEPTDLKFTHKIPYVGAGFLASVKIAGAGQGGADSDWWLDAGADFLAPLSGRQTDSSGGTVAFKPTGKLILGLFGLSTRLPLSESWDLGGNFHGYYNLTSTGGSSFYGARLALSLTALL